MLRIDRVPVVNADIAQIDAALTHVGQLEVRHDLIDHCARIANLVVKLKWSPCHRWSRIAICASLPMRIGASSTAAKREQNGIEVLLLGLIDRFPVIFQNTTTIFRVGIPRPIGPVDSPRACSQILNQGCKPLSISIRQQFRATLTNPDRSNSLLLDIFPMGAPYLR